MADQLTRKRRRIKGLKTAQVEQPPHNGADGYRIRDPLRPGEEIGGQNLMIRLCLSYPRVVQTWGRRGGKSTGCRHLFREEQSVTRGRYTCGYVAQDHAKAAEMYNLFMQDLGGDPKQNPHSLVKKCHPSNGQDRWIETHPFAMDEFTCVNGDAHETGGRYYFWSGMKPTYEFIRGYQFPFHRIVVDESAFIDKECVFDILLKMLTDVGGHFLAIGTPKAGKPGNSWFETVFRWGQSADYPEWVSMRFPSEVNPEIKPKHHKQARRDCLTKEEQMQELDALFLADMGAVFRNLSACFTLQPLKHPLPWFTSAQQDKPAPKTRAFFTEPIDPLGRYVMGVDWALKEDHSVITVFRLDCPKPRQVCLVRFPTGMVVNWDTITHFVSCAHEAYNNATIYSDENGVGAGMTERLARRYGDGVVPENFTYSKKPKYVRRTQMLFEEADFELIDWVTQREEFRKYSQLDSGGAYPRFGHPEGIEEHDDTVDSVMMVSEMLSLGERKPLEAKKQDYPMGSMGWFKQFARARRAHEVERKAQI